MCASLFGGSKNDMESLLFLHENLCHPGVRCLGHFVHSQNLPYSLNEIKKVTTSCQVCAELKPYFYRPEEAHLVKATRPFERVSMDFKGPLPLSTGTQYMLILVDEYSHFPFTFPCADLSTTTAIKCLTNLFSIFSMPLFLHLDRGAQFMSAELKGFLTNRTGLLHYPSNKRCVQQIIKIRISFSTKQRRQVIKNG